MNAGQKRPWTLRDNAWMIVFFAVFTIVVEPWLHGRAPGLDDVYGFVAVVVGLTACIVISRTVETPASFLPSDYPSGSTKTPQVAYIVAGVGLLAALITIAGVFASIAMND